MPQDQTERTEAATAMHHLLAGGWVAQLIHTAAELGLADHFGEEAKDVASLAGATATHPPSLSRLLRALAAVGVVHETDDRRYMLTSLGATLRTDDHGSMRAWAVAGDDRDIGQRVEPVDLGDRTRQKFGGIEPAVEQLARRQDVRIRQLDDDHWLLPFFPSASFYADKRKAT